MKAEFLKDEKDFGNFAAKIFGDGNHLILSEQIVYNKFNKTCHNRLWAR